MRNHGTLQPPSCILGPYTQLVRYEKRLLPVDEVASLLLCCGMAIGEVFEWLERRGEFGRFAQ